MTAIHCNSPASKLRIKMNLSRNNLKLSRRISFNRLRDDLDVATEATSPQDVDDRDKPGHEEFGQLRP
jgi:hypothetical protein